MTWDVDAYLCVDSRERAFAIQSSHVSALEIHDDTSDVAHLSEVIGFAHDARPRAAHARVLVLGVMGATARTHVDRVEGLVTAAAADVLVVPDVVRRLRPTLHGLLRVEGRAYLVVDAGRVCAAASRRDAPTSELEVIR